MTTDRFANRNDSLPRLDRRFYRGLAYVHWTLTMQNRATGWRVPIFYYKFRELLTHAAFRYQLVCPIYCLMPDHFHLLWIGAHENADQLNAMKYFRKQLAVPLERLGCELQHQPYDHVLQDDERREEAIESLVDYIARNPERAELVAVDGFRSYQYTGNLIPGYPELCLWQPDYWLRFWRIYSHFLRNGLSRIYLDAEADPH